MSKLVHPLSNFQEAPAVSPRIFTWISNGDSSGVLYFLGRNFGTDGWENPHTAGRSIFVRSSTGDTDDGVVGLCDRAISYVTTDDIVGEWFAVDLGVGHTLKVATYALQNGATVNFLHSPYNWKLEGSNDVAPPYDVSDYASATWFEIDDHVNDTAIAQTSGAWGTFAPGDTTPYRFLRVISTGLNRALDTNHLQIGEMEFYGEFAF